MIRLRVLVSVLSVMVLASALAVLMLSAQLTEGQFSAAFALGAMGIGGLAWSWVCK